MTNKKGILYGIGAYLSWGFFPIYFKALQSLPALQIMLNRLVWSFGFLLLILVIRREWSSWLASIRAPRRLGIYTLAGILLAINWLVYIYGVNSGQIVETSLGYFINPLVSVALGVIFLRERLRALQWLPVGLAATGVLYLTIQVGSLPWIALALAFSFGLYGLIKKISPLGSLYGLTLETGMLFFPAAGLLLFWETQGNGAFGSSTGWVILLLILSGVVTALPLLMFAQAARSIPLWMVGILQYIAPTVQFLIGVLLYNEPFDTTRLIGFSIIWLALLIFSLEGFFNRRHSRARERAAQAGTQIAKS